MSREEEAEEERKKAVKWRAVNHLEELINEIEKGKFEGYFMIAKNGLDDTYAFFADPSTQAMRRAFKSVEIDKKTVEDEAEARKAYA